MHIWTLENWMKYYPPETSQVRSGLRLRFDKTVDPEVKRACKEFCTWLRTEYYFPIRVPIYMRNKKTIKAKDGEEVSAIFSEPYDRSDEPYIRIAVGDYPDLLKRGKDNALAAILGSIAHELTHYFQWINDIQLTPIGEERQATMYAGYILDEYAHIRDHP